MNPDQNMPSMSMNQVLHGTTSDAETFSPESFVSFRLLEIVGQGGMGIVYRAMQERPQRVVALKIMKHAALLRDRRRFKREIEILGRLQHPGISRLYSVGEVESVLSGRAPFLAMEFIEGCTISDYVRRKDLSRHDKVQLMVQVCETVGFAHRHGVIHRDLKPSNILVDATGVPRILDFGLATIMDRQAALSTVTEDGQLLGTLDYMSPEQALGQSAALDERTDVYSLGVVLFELLSGERPYDLSSCSIVEALRRIQSTDAASLGPAKGPHRGDLNIITSTAMAKDRTRRYVSVEALGDDLRRYLDDEPILARRPTLVYRARKFTRRNRVFLSTVSVVVAVLTAGLVMALRANSRTKEFQRETSIELAYSTLSRGDLYMEDGHFTEARSCFNEAWNKLESLHESAYPAIVAMFELDRRSARPIRVLSPSHALADQVSATAFSSDGMLALGYNNGRVEVRNPVTNALDFAEQLPDTVWSLAFSPDGRMLMADGPKAIRLWDWRQKTEIRVPNSKGVGKLSVSIGDEGLAFVNRDDELHTMDFAGNVRQRKLPFQDYYGLALRGTSVEFIDKQANFWTIPFDGGVPQTTPVPTHGDEFALSPQGSSLLVIGGSASVFELPSLNLKSQWNTGAATPLMGYVNEQTLWIQKEPTAPVELIDLAGHLKMGIPGKDGAAVKSDDKFATGPDDDGLETLYACRLPTAIRLLVPASDQPTAAAISPDGSVVAATLESGHLRLIDAQEGNTTVNLADSSPAAFLDFSADGRSLVAVASDNTIQRWDMAKRELQRSFQVQQVLCSFAIAPSCQELFYSDSSGGNIVESHLSPAPARTVNVGLRSINCVAVSPDQNLGLAISDSGLVLWNINSTDLRLKTDISGNQCAFLEDGLTIAVSPAPDTVDFLDARTLAVKSHVSVPRIDGSWTAFGGNIAYGSAGNVVILNGRHPETPRTIRLSADRVGSLRGSRDGLRLICLTSRGIIEFNFDLEAELRKMDQSRIAASTDPKWFDAAGLAQ